MCGLVGVAGWITQGEEKVFKTLLEIDTARGPHSTGILKVERGAKYYSVQKELGTPWDLYSTMKRGSAGLFPNTYEVLAGHNRYATQGKINEDNAHPFDMENIVGMHNGTLLNQKLLDDHEMFDVDSENIYHHMSKHGFRDTIRKCDGAFALVWWDKKDKRLHFVRNSQRPLHYSFSEDRKVLYWASEPWMLRAAFDRHNVKHTEIVALPVEQIFSFNVPSQFKETFHDIRTGKVEVYERPSYLGNGYGNIYSGNRGGYSGGTRVQNKTDNNTFMPSPERLRAYIGRTVDLIPVEWRREDTSNNIPSYIECKIKDDPVIRARVFEKPGSVWWKATLAGKVNLKARIRGMNAKKQNRYLKVDKRSLREVEEKKSNVIQLPDGNKGGENSEKKSNPKYYECYNGLLVSRKELEGLMHNGCAWCCDFPEEDQYKGLLWIARDEFICAECLTMDDVKDFLDEGGVMR